MEQTIKKSRRAMARVKDVMRLEGWMAPSVKLTLLDTVVRSVMLYATGVWAGNLLNIQETRNKWMKKLSVIYNMGLRAATGLDRRIPLWVLYVTAKRVAVHIVIRKIVWRYAGYLRNMKEEQVRQG